VFYILSIKITAIIDIKIQSGIFGEAEFFRYEVEFYFVAGELWD
jgi:hypothetical protein